MDASTWNKQIDSCREFHLWRLATYRQSLNLQAFKNTASKKLDKEINFANTRFFLYIWSQQLNIENNITQMNNTNKVIGKYLFCALLTLCGSILKAQSNDSLNVETALSEKKQSLAIGCWVGQEKRDRSPLAFRSINIFYIYGARYWHYRCYGWIWRKRTSEHKRIFEFCCKKSDLRKCNKVWCVGVTCCKCLCIGWICVNHREYECGYYRWQTAITLTSSEAKYIDCHKS